LSGVRKVNDFWYLFGAFERSPKTRNARGRQILPDIALGLAQGRAHPAETAAWLTRG
jgi:hypothetical protein